MLILLVESSLKTSNAGVSKSNYKRQVHLPFQSIVFVIVSNCRIKNNNLLSHSTGSKALFRTFISKQINKQNIHYNTQPPEKNLCK